jgi:hypothetical protein
VEWFRNLQENSKQENSKKAGAQGKQLLATRLTFEEA